MSDYTISTPGISGITALAPAHQTSTTASPSTPASARAEALPGTAAVYAVGSYLVGDTEDTLLNGHPDIRY